MATGDRHKPTSSKPPPPSSGRARPPKQPTPSSLRIPIIDYDVVNAARRIVEGSLSVVPGERVLIVVDRERQDLAPPIAEVTKAIGAEPIVILLDDLEPRPVRALPPKLRAAMDRSQASILLAGFVDGEQPMRFEFLERVKELGLRHAHMVGVTRRSMMVGFSCNPARIVETTRSVRTRIRGDSVLKLRTPAGSDLEVKLTPLHRWVEHVGVIRPGRWENLPSGEIITAPSETRGVFVADASMGGHFGAAAGLLTRTPVRLEIENSTVKSVSSVDRTLQREVESFMRREHFADGVGTIVMGTNVGILNPIGELICDQNLPGLHLTLGSTFPEMTGAPSRTRAQLSFTCAQSDVDLDGAPLLRSGRYML